MEEDNEYNKRETNEFENSSSSIKEDSVKKELDKERLKRLVNLVKFKFEFIAVVVIVIGIFKIDLGNVDCYLEPAVIVVEFQVALTFLYILQSIVGDFIFRKEVRDSVIDGGFKLILFEIYSVSVIAVPLIFGISGISAILFDIMIIPLAGWSILIALYYAIIKPIRIITYKRMMFIDIKKLLKRIKSEFLPLEEFIKKLPNFEENKKIWNEVMEDARIQHEEIRDEHDIYDIKTARIFNKYVNYLFELKIKIASFRDQLKVYPNIKKTETFIDNLLKGSSDLKKYEKLFEEYLKDSTNNRLTKNDDNKLL